MNKIFLLTVIILVTTSCNRHLDREEAKKQISKTENYPVIVDYEFTKGFTKDYNTQGNGVTIDVGGDDWESKKRKIESFEKAGLITFEETPHREETTAFLLGTTIRTWTSVKVSLTDEGKKYLLKETNNNFDVKLWETILNDVTGIQEMDQQKTAKVDYTISNKNITPFGESFSNKNETTQKTIYFSLYDDGWRINK
jgi:hypothetical protein